MQSCSSFEYHGYNAGFSASCEIDLFGRVRNAVAAARAVLSPLRAQRDGALTIARDRAADAERLSQLRFDQGADGFLSLLDARRTLAQSEAALAQSDGLLTSYQIAVFQALGGGG